MRMMGAESVAYHRRTVLERGDDYPGMTLAYYASRGSTEFGRTPLMPSGGLCRVGGERVVSWLVRAVAAGKALGIIRGR
jgi:hypothetical protein